MKGTPAEGKRGLGQEEKQEGVKMKKSGDELRKFDADFLR